MTTRKHSIKTQYMLVLSGMMALTVVVLWLSNSLLLGDFYIKDKKEAIIRAYDQINAEATKGEIRSEEFSVTFHQIASRDNLEMLVLDSDKNVVLTTGHDDALMADRLMGYFFRGIDESAVIYERDGLYVQRSYDDVLKMEFIELWGLLGNHNMIVMRSPVESIRDSVRIANRLLAFVGISVLMLGLALAALLLGKITRPIKTLAEISERMARLDFNAKYDDKGRRNEIDVLGLSMNKMSDKLESTILALKKANNELEVDLARKTEIDEMRKEFLSNVSHELKTPIALIQGYAEGLKDCVNEDAESRDYYCDVIIDEAAKMNTMVRQLLELNKLENSAALTSFERFDLTELVHSCIQSVDILLKQNDIKLHFAAEDHAFVWSDAYKIEQVVNNYLSNAIHHADGKKEIEVSIEPRGDVIRFQVFNTGEPIPDAELSNIWVKFYKTDKARTRTDGGTGIGLSIVKAVAESLNRAYGVVNYDNGVAFWFDIERDTGRESD